jgi:hypothetical protein
VPLLQACGLRTLFTTAVHTAAPVQPGRLLTWSHREGRDAVGNTYRGSSVCSSHFWSAVDSSFVIRAAISSGAAKSCFDFKLFFCGDGRAEMEAPSALLGKEAHEGEGPATQSPRRWCGASGRRGGRPVAGLHLGGYRQAQVRGTDTLDSLVNPVTTNHASSKSAVTLPIVTSNSDSILIKGATEKLEFSGPVSRPGSRTAQVWKCVFATVRPFAAK